MSAVARGGDLLFPLFLSLLDQVIVLPLIEGEPVGHEHHGQPLLDGHVLQVHGNLTLDVLVDDDIGAGLNPDRPQDISDVGILEVEGDAHRVRALAKKNEGGK